MRAAFRAKFTNNLFYTTFAVAFITVAGSSVMPCPAHSINNEDEKMYQEQQQQQQVSQRQ
jgi:cytochrome c oxidase assembly factor 2